MCRFESIPQIDRHIIKFYSDNALYPKFFSERCSLTDFRTLFVFLSIVILFYNSLGKC